MFLVFRTQDESKKTTVTSTLESPKNQIVPQLEQQEKIVDGKYMSREDTLAGIEIRGEKLIMFHKSTKIDTSDFFNFKITDTIIDNGRSLSGGRFLTLSNDQMTLKYAIENWDENWISLIYLPRGNSHNYYREK